MQPIIRHAPENGWFAAIFLVILIVLCWIQFTNNNWFKLLKTALISNKSFWQFIRDEQAVINRISYLLLFVYLLALTTFLFQAISVLHPSKIETTGSLLFLWLFSGLLAFMVLKTLLFKLTGNVFRLRNETVEYLFNAQLTNIFLGLGLFPVIVFTAYLPYLSPHILIYTGLILIGFVFLIRVVKSFYLGITSTNFSTFYIILYICTLEFLPLIVIIKAFIE